MKKIILYDCYNHKLHENCDVIGTVVQHFGRWGLTNGWKVVEIEE
jgi:hypothetical protein